VAHGQKTKSGAQGGDVPGMLVLDFTLETIMAMAKTAGRVRI